MHNEIKAIRERLGWSQDYLAHRIGCSRAHVIALEKGKSEPSLELGLKISRAFRRPVERIFSLSAPNGHQSAEGDDALDCQSSATA